MTGPGRHRVARGGIGLRRASEGGVVGRRRSRARRTRVAAVRLPRPVALRGKGQTPARGRATENATDTGIPTVGGAER